jgi:hypothetical protein
MRLRHLVERTQHGQPGSPSGSCVRSRALLLSSKRGTARHASSIKDDSSEERQEVALRLGGVARSTSSADSASERIYWMPRCASIAPRMWVPRSMRHQFRVSTDAIRAGQKRMPYRASRPAVIGSPPVGHRTIPAAGLSEWLRETGPVRAGRLGGASGT